MTGQLISYIRIKPLLHTGSHWCFFWSVWWRDRHDQSAWSPSSTVIKPVGSHPTGKLHPLCFHRYMSADVIADTIQESGGGQCSLLLGTFCSTIVPRIAAKLWCRSRLEVARTGPNAACPWLAFENIFIVAHHSVFTQTSWLGNFSVHFATKPGPEYDVFNLHSWQPQFSEPVCINNKASGSLTMVTVQSVCGKCNVYKGSPVARQSQLEIFPQELINLVIRYESRKVKK